MKRILIAIALILGCFSVAPAAEPAAPPKRIISLAPSTTEILFALGLGDRIVGVTTFCDYPEAAKTKAKIGGMTNPSLEAIVGLKPDLVVLTTDGNPREVEERLRSMNIKTFVFTARTLHDLPAGIRAMAAATGVSGKGDQVAGEIEKALSGSAPKAQVPGTHRKKVLYIVWPEPLIVAGPGTAIHDAITMLGDVNIAQGAATAYPKYSIEEVIRQAPDVIVVGKGSGMDMVAVSRGLLKKMTSVPAVKSGAICYLGDGLYRLGPRVVQGIEELAACLNQK
jgi:iron complex transport system substrate-binding protein